MLNSSYELIKTVEAQNSSSSCFRSQRLLSFLHSHRQHDVRIFLRSVHLQS